MLYYYTKSRTFKEASMKSVLKKYAKRYFIDAMGAMALGL